MLSVTLAGYAGSWYTGAASISRPPSLPPEKQASRNTRTDFAPCNAPSFSYRSSSG